MEECITRLHLDGKELILIGTIHMSKRSVEQVKAVIETERPETVCVELDDLRSVALAKASTEADAVPADGDSRFSSSTPSSPPCKSALPWIGACCQARICFRQSSPPRPSARSSFLPTATFRLLFAAFGRVSA